MRERGKMDTIYIITQSPYLQFKTEIFPTSTKLISESEKWISEKEGDILRNISLRIPENIPSNFTIKDWYSHVQTIQNEVIRWRKGDRNSLHFISKDLLEKQDPLEREMTLLKIHWDWIEENIGEDMNFPHLIRYLLQIKILEKIQSFNPVQGNEEFEKLCSQVTNP